MGSFEVVLSLLVISYAYVVAILPPERLNYLSGAQCVHSRSTNEPELPIRMIQGRSVPRLVKNLASLCAAASTSSPRPACVAASEASERMESRRTFPAAAPRSGVPSPGQKSANRRRSRTLAARQAWPDQPEDRARRNDPLCALALGRPHSLPRRRLCRHQLERRGAHHPPDRTGPKECSLRRF